MKSKFRGAGGTSGGCGSFFIGLVMASAGFYLLLSRILVSQGFGFHNTLFHGSFGGGWSITGGSLLIPFMFGIGFIFYNARAPWGWILAGGALCAILFGVIMNLHIGMQRMSLLDLLIILVLMVGGLGIFARSLRDSS